MANELDVDLSLTQGSGRSDVKKQGNMIKGYINIHVSVIGGTHICV